MADYMTLMGSEDVSRAGYAMREAAHEMSRAASNIDSAHRDHQRYLEDWLAQFSAVLFPAEPAPSCSMCKRGAAFSKERPGYHVTEFWEGHERSQILCKDVPK